MKYFLRYLAGHSLRPFAWYRARAGGVVVGGCSADVDSSPRHDQWLRRSFIAGFFVTVPLIVSVAALVWIFGVVDGFTGPIYTRLLGREVPGLGILTTAVLVLLVGALATNVIGKRLLQRAEGTCCWCRCSGRSTRRSSSWSWRSRRTTSIGFKRVVMVEDPARGFVIGFLTREFTLDRGQGPEALLAVYVPTNHLYLGDVLIVPRERATFPDILVEEGIRIFLTGGMALPGRVRGRRGDDRVKNVRV